MIARLRSWIWLLVLLLFAASVFVKLNGSSVGYWTEIFYESGKPPGLLFSTPKHVRADEWHGWTPAVLSQARQSPPFPLQNLSLGGGRIPMLMSVPIAHYSTLFRPQFWGFFIFDFERAFSFFWCCKIFALLLITPWFLRQLGVQNKGVILFGTIWLFFSDYVQWWFSSPAMLPEMLATWMICTGCALRFFQKTNRWRLGLAFAAFVFCGINFVLCFYPPFQVPLLFLMAAILIGRCLELRQTGVPYSTAHGLLFTGFAILALFALLVPFWIDARATFDLVAHTAYPGARRSTGGQLSLFKLFSGLAGFFQREELFPTAYDNICEASNFYPLWPAALAAVLIARWRSRAAISPLIIALGIVVISFSIFCVVPLPAWLVRATLLSYVTERRMLLTIGLANILLCTVFFDRYRQQILARLSGIVVGLIFWLGVVALFWAASRHNPGFFPGHIQLGLALIANAVILLLFFVTKRRWSAVVLAGLLVFNNIGTNPIMQGLAPLINSQAFLAVDKLRASDPTAKWIVYHDFILAQLVIATGAPTLNGNKVVPDFTFLRRLDAEGTGNPVYNRYAYVYCEIPENGQSSGVALVQHDCYKLFLPPNLPLLRELGNRFVVFPGEWADAGANGFSSAAALTTAKIWIYRRQNTEP